MRLLSQIFFVLIITNYSTAQSIGNTDRSFSKLQCGLFINSNGDIGIETPFLLDDMGNKGIRYQTWAYMSNKKDETQSEITELKNIVDTASFRLLNDFYCKDKNRVYYIFYTSSGATIVLSNTLDPKTFEVYGRTSYGADKKTIYFRDEPLLKADRKTFEALDEYKAKDKTNKYFYGKIENPIK